MKENVSVPETRHLLQGQGWGGGLVLHFLCVQKPFLAELLAHETLRLHLARRLRFGSDARVTGAAERPHNLLC